MLSDSLDPDQDLQSGSKLFTWYDVCCNIGGGGGDCVLVVKFSRGDYVLVVKFTGGILSTYTKMSRGGFVRGGLCPYPFYFYINTFQCFIQWMPPSYHLSDSHFFFSFSDFISRCVIQAPFYIFDWQAVILYINIYIIDQPDSFIFNNNQIICF